MKTKLAILSMAGLLATPALADIQILQVYLAFRFVVMLAISSLRPPSWLAVVVKITTPILNGRT